MSETRKLTRQERKEALAKWDSLIALAEKNYDEGSYMNWRGWANDLQVQRAAHLAELEGRTTNEVTP